ncbi:hypothetical protein HQ585_06230 [candidate division KSB1 bacterium]|nr:hypothetical protein [candidate division KSB1 bacterium]
MIRYQKLGFILLLISLGSVQAQRKPLDFFTAVKGDSVFLYLNQTPRIGQGFIVEWRNPDDSEFERLTGLPISPVVDAGQARLILGSYYSDLMTALKLESDEGLLIKLRTDPYYGQIAMLMDRRAAMVLGRYFAAGDHIPDATYRYRVTLVDRKGKSVDSKERDVLVQEKTPTPVRSLTCRQEQMSVVLEWDYPQWSGDMTDLVFQFLLFRSHANSPFERIHDHPILRLEGFPLQYVDREIEFNRIYTYRMVALDAAGLISESVDIVLNTQDNIPPKHPDGLITEGLGNGVSLSWNHSKESDVAGYHVYRWNAGEKDSVLITDSLIPAGQVQYVDSTAAMAISYFYAVSAVDMAGNESPHSNRMDALITDKTPPGPPGCVSALIKDHVVLLNWHPSPDLDVTGYEVRRGYNEEKAYRLQEELVADTSFIDDGAKGSKWIPGGQYYYSVVAVDTMTYRSIPVGVWIDIPDDEPPLTPGRVMAENHLGREILVTWNPSISGDVSAYRILRIAEQDTTILDTLRSNLRNFTDKDIEKGNRFAYGVAAVDTAGNVSRISVSDPVTLRDFDPPTASAFVTAVIMNEGVQIRWEPVGDFDLAGYNIYKGELPTSVGEKLNIEPIADTHWINAKGQTGHWYWVRSIDTSGNKSRNSIAASTQLQ